MRGRPGWQSIIKSSVPPLLLLLPAPHLLFRTSPLSSPPLPAPRRQRTCPPRRSLLFSHRRRWTARHLVSISTTTMLVNAGIFTAVLGAACSLVSAHPHAHKTRTALPGDWVQSEDHPVYELFRRTNLNKRQSNSTANSTSGVPAVGSSGAPPRVSYFLLSS